MCCSNILHVLSFNLLYQVLFKSLIVNMTHIPFQSILYADSNHFYITKIQYWKGKDMVNNVIKMLSKYTEYLSIVLVLSDYLFSLNFNYANM